MRLLDAVIPPAKDAEIARLITGESLIPLLRREALPDEPWITYLFPYSNRDIRALIKALKYRGERAPLLSIGKIIGDEILDMLYEKRSFEGWDAPLMIPIPGSAKRVRERGFSQAERIADALMPVLKDAVTYLPDALKKDERKSQVQVPRTKRVENVFGSFSVKETKIVFGKCIILIDDVVESGATLKDAKRALLGAGAKDVIALAIAH